MKREIDLLVSDKNTCQYTGIEKTVQHKYGKELSILVDNFNQYRFRVIIDGEPVAVLWLVPENKSAWTIGELYVIRSKRRLGLGTQLVYVARSMLKNVNHSEWLTKDGKKFAMNTQ